MIVLPAKLNILSSYEAIPNFPRLLEPGRKTFI
jgi:hypothetical protein